MGLVIDTAFLFSVMVSTMLTDGKTDIISVVRADDVRTYRGEVTAVEVALDYPIPRTWISLSHVDGNLKFVVPGSNGAPPAVAMGYPLLQLGSEIEVDLVEAKVGLSPPGPEKIRILSEPYHRYQVNGLKYDQERLPLGFYLNSRGSEDLGFEETEALVEKAFEAWTQVGCSYAQFVYLGTTAIEANDDGMNVLQWVHDDWEWPNEVVGLTITRFDTSGEFPVPAGADIVFNAQGWRWLLGAGNVTGSPRSVHAGTIVLHELGHVLGMDHEYENVTSTMYYSYLGGTWQGSLSGDDRRGLCAIYDNGEHECQDNADCSEFDEASICREIDAVKVCDVAYDSIGTLCGLQSYGCEDVCIFASVFYSEGYCSAVCVEDGDCPVDFHCGQGNVLLPDKDTMVCLKDVGPVVVESTPEEDVSITIESSESATKEQGCRSVPVSPVIGYLFGLMWWYRRYVMFVASSKKEKCDEV